MAYDIGRCRDQDRSLRAPSLQHRAISQVALVATSQLRLFKISKACERRSLQLIYSSESEGSIEDASSPSSGS